MPTYKTSITFRQIREEAYRAEADTGKRSTKANRPTAITECRTKDLPVTDEVHVAVAKYIVPTVLKRLEEIEDQLKSPIRIHLIVFCQIYRFLMCPHQLVPVRCHPNLILAITGIMSR